MDYVRLEHSPSSPGFLMNFWTLFMTLFHFLKFPSLLLINRLYYFEKLLLVFQIYHGPVDWNSSNDYQARR